MISPTGRTLFLAPVRPNLGIEIAYRKRLDAAIEAMQVSLMWWIGAAYRANEPELLALAQDASPARTLLEVIRRLVARWQGRFDTLADELAAWFATQAKSRSDAALKASLRKAGFTVRFHMTRPVNDAYQAVIGENVGLIRSIAQEHLSAVEGHVMRSVQVGRNLGSLASALETQFGVTKRRAALIARDQNNKATAVISRVRQQELGIVENVWMHSGGGREPRPTHVRAGREKIRYRIAEGWLDPAINKRIWPGTEINCRCVSRPVIPGFR